MKLIIKIILISFLPFILISVILLVSNYIIYENLFLSYVDKNAENELNVYNDSITNYFNINLARLKIIAATPVIKSRNIGNILNYLKKEQKKYSNSIEGLYYNTREGLVYDVNYKTFSVRDRYYFSQIDRGEIVITKMIISKATQRPIVLLLVPVFDDNGNRTGAIGGTILIKDVISLIKNLNTGKEGFSILLDKDKNIITSKNDIIVKSSNSKNKKNKNLMQIVNLTRNLQKNPYYTVMDGKEFFVYKKRISSIGSEIILSYEKKEVLGKLYYIKIFGYISIVIISVIFVIFMVVIKQTILKPLTELITAHKEFGNGDLETSISNISNDEIGKLSESFNNMSGQIKKYTHDLMTEIKERKKAEEFYKELSKEKEILVKEIHHRTKNNMQLVSSILELEYSKCQTDLDGSVINDIKQKIQTMALVHEMLYQTENMASIEFNKYLNGLIGTIKKNFHSIKLISINIYCDNVLLDLDRAIPIGLIINELITNSYKHAFNEKDEGIIEIGLEEADGLVKLNISDNGSGMSEINLADIKTLGLTIITSLVEQLKGEIKFDLKNGTNCIIAFRL